MLYEVITDGIRKPQELIQKALQGDAPIYHGGNKTVEEPENKEKKSVGNKIYKDLMNGIS